MEVRVCDDVSQRIDVMFICGEWGSSKGGLSAFNREFAVNLAKATRDQTKVYCHSVFIMRKWRDKGGLERRTWRAWNEFVEHVRRLKSAILVSCVFLS